MGHLAIFNIFLAFAIPVVMIYTVAWIGFPISILANRRETTIRVDINSVIFGISLIVLVLFFSAFLEYSVSKFSLLLLATSTVLNIGFILIRRNRFLNELKLKTLILSCASGVLVFAPKLIEAGLSGSLFPVISLGNHDIAYYLAAANQFENTGFVNSNQIDQNDLNVAVRRFHYFTPTALLAFMHSIFGQWIGFYSTAIMIFALSLLFLGFHAFTKTFSAKKDSVQIPIIISFIAITISINQYIVASVFLAQVLAFSVVAAMFANLVRVIFPPHRFVARMEPLIWASLTVLSVFTYPAILLPLLLGLILVILVVTILRAVSQLVTKMIFAGVIVGLIASGPYLLDAWQLLKLLAKGPFGWSLPPLNSISVFLMPNIIGYSFPHALTVLSWIGVIAFGIHISIKLAMTKLHLQIMMFLIVIPIASVIIFTLMRGKGFSDYGAWKLITYFAPFTVLLVLTVWTHSKKFPLSWLYFTAGLLSMGPTLLWSSNPGLMSNQYLVNMSSNTRLQMLDSINVDLPTPFETMLATTLFGNETTIFLRSQSYLPTSSNFDECAVVRSDNNRYPFKQPINSFYALGSTNQQACSQYLNGQNMNQILTNSSLQTRIGSGWWEEEDWGTWMRSTDASIPLIRDFRQGDVIQIYFRTLGSSYFETFAPEISLNGNSFVLTAEEYDSGNFRIKITQELINSEERYTLGFKVQNLIAPSEIGLNSDSRPFGLGVESLEFSDAKRNMP